MEYKECTLAEACEIVVQQRLVAINGDGGLIAVDAKGNICLEFNTDGMYRAMKKSTGEMSIGIYR